MMPSAKRLCGFPLAALMSLLVACSPAGFHSAAARQVHDDGYGVLSAGKGAGANSVFPPTGAVDWYAAFGGTALCVQEKNHRDVVVTGVRLQYGRQPPLSGRPLLRTVSPSFARTFSDKDVLLPDYGRAGLTAAIIRPGAVTGATRLHLHVDVSCSQLAADIRRLNTDKNILHPLHEVVALMRSDAGGAVLTRVLIDYRDGDELKTLRIEWRSDMCGTDVVGQRCPAGAHQ